MRHAGAAALALAVLHGCALAHERDSDASIVGRDAGPIATDAGPAPLDVGPIRACEDFWSGLPSCPASPELAIGFPCGVEGATCGVHCCEPGPPIGCREGRWEPLSFMEDCAGVRCRDPHRCGGGACASGRVCVVPVGELGSPTAENCVVPPSPIDMCSDAPPGALGTDPGACVSCSCGDGFDGEPVIRIDCFCC